jgi:hypothetical protein
MPRRILTMKKAAIDSTVANVSLAAVAAACAAILWGAIAAEAAASAERGAARTDITMQSWPDRGYFGFVESPRARCADGRRVVVFNRDAESGKDRVGAVRSHRHHGAYQWSIRTTGPGAFYAKATRTAGCKAARSKKLASQPGGPEVPACPSTEEICRFDELHIDTGFGTYCPAFSKASAKCNTFTESGPIPWCCWRQGYIGWDEDRPGTSRRTFNYSARSDTGYTETAFLVGSLPGPGSANFTIANAGAPVWSEKPNTRWYTPDLPAVSAGNVGGPLHLNFRNGTYGADVFIRGYLFMKK